MTATATAGSNGAQDFLQTTTSNSALQGDVGTSADTGYKTVPFGVFGVYDSTAHFGVGVLGASLNGYGIAADSLSSSASILAYPGGAGDGIDATTTGNGGSALYAIAKGNDSGIQGITDGSGDAGYFNSNSGTGLVATGPGATGVAQLALANGSGGAFDGYGEIAPAVTIAEHEYGLPLLTASNAELSDPVFYIQGTTQDRSQDVNFAGSDVQIQGDLYLRGRVFEECYDIPATSSTDCQDVDYNNSAGISSVTRSSNGNDVRMYGTRETLPSVEDDGQGQLVGGRAYVRIDPAFAATMSRSTPYLVFITPEGQSHGVYAANRTLSGFEVRENDGGRSTTAFDYRIVARPFGDTSTRLATVVPRRKAAPARRFSPAEIVANAHALKTKLMLAKHAPIRSPMELPALPGR